MSTKRPSPRKTSRQPKIVKQMREAAAAFPEHAGQFAIAQVPKKTPGKTQRCVLWGVDPVTGKPVCLKWEPM